jgi:hypothetical protein
MLWKETPLGRLTLHIHHLFEEHLRKHPLSDYREHNALLDVRNLVVQAVESFLNEPAIKKKYGVPINSMGLVSFADAEEPINPKSSWIPIPSNEDATRPAGITNEEYTEFTERLNKLFFDHGIYTSPLYVNVLTVFREAFLRPTENRPFKEGTYTRLIFGCIANAEIMKKQTVPCEICGENRVVDTCHIIPRRVKGTQKIDNVIFLCTTHHRLFDDCMLSKEEWDRIEWTRKARKSQIYAEKVLKVAHGKFWAKVDAGIYRKQSREELDVLELRRLHRENSKDIEE